LISRMSNATGLPSSALPPIPPNIAQIATPVLIGILVSWAFWGMLLVQVYIYSILFRDKLLIQLFVYSVFVIDTLQTLMTAVDACYWFASGFGDLTHLGNVYLSVFDVPILGSVLALLGQTFLCYRIYILSKDKWIPALLFTICLMSLTGAWYNGIRGHILAASIETAQATIDTRALYVWLISAVVGDTGIAAVMTYLLLRARGKYRATDVVLNRLVILTMETNSISATLAILTLILYIAAPGTSYFLTPTYPLGKCYANALLVTLNNRYFLLSSKGHSTGVATFGQSKGKLSLATTLGDSTEEYSSNTGVKISTFKNTTTDDSFQLDNFERSPKNKTAHL